MKCLFAHVAQLLLMIVTYCIRVGYTVIHTYKNNSFLMHYAEIETITFFSYSSSSFFVSLFFVISGGMFVQAIPPTSSQGGCSPPPPIPPGFTPLTRSLIKHVH